MAAAARASLPLRAGRSSAAASSGKRTLCESDQGKHGGDHTQAGNDGGDHVQPTLVQVIRVRRVGVHGTVGTDDFQVILLMMLLSFIRFGQRY